MLTYNYNKGGEKMEEYMIYTDQIESYEPVMESAGALAAVLAFFAAYMGVIAIVGIVMMIALWKIFVKANKPGWAAIVPIYNLVVLFEICGLNPLLLLVLLIPGLNALAMMVFGIFTTIKLGQAFGKSNGFILGMLFIPWIFYPMLAFGKAQYTSVN